MKRRLTIEDRIIIHQLLKFITNLLSTFSNFPFTLNCSNQSKLFSLSLVFNLSFFKFNLLNSYKIKKEKNI